MTDQETLDAIRDLCHTILREKWVGVMESKTTWSDARYYEELVKYRERQLVAKTILKLMGERINV